MDPPFFTTIRMLNGRTIDPMTFAVKKPLLVAITTLGRRSVIPMWYAIAKVYDIIEMICNVIKKPCPVAILEVRRRTSYTDSSRL